MKELKGKKGITLVALIITIIILLILAVVAISAVHGDGIIEYAKNARDEYTQAQLNENATLDSYLAELDENADFLATIQIGDKVAYNEGSGKTSTIDSTFVMDDLEWRVLDIEADGTVELISTQPTTSTLTLSGEEGYLNGPENLDTLCNDLYANGTGVTARSLKVEDVDKLAGIITVADKQALNSSYGSLWRYKYDVTTARIQYSTSTDNGTTWTDYTKTHQSKYKEPGGIEINSTNYQDSEGNLIVNEQEYTSYSYTISSKITQTTSDNISVASLLLQGLNNTNTAASGADVSQWLSSRCVACNSDRAGFRVQMLNNGGVNCYYLWYSYCDSTSPAYAVRPVVSLPASAILTKVDGIWQVEL